MPTVITFSVSALPPLKNALRGRHWSAGYQAKQEWSWLLKAAATKEDARILRAWTDMGCKVIVETHIQTPKLYDEDNLGSCGNVCLDALKWIQFIFDDNPAHLQFEKPTQSIGPKRITFKIRKAS